jgi:hypothetical protein
VTGRAKLHGMLRFLLALALLLPSLARAEDKPKPSEAPAIWPPAPDEDAPKKPAPKAKKGGKDAKEKDEPKENSDEPLPRLTDDEDAHHPAPVVNEAPEDPCDAPFDECREDCTITHSNDDTSKMGGRKPLVTCIARCNKARAACEERRSLGLQEKRHDDSPP